MRRPLEQTADTVRRLTMAQIRSLPDLLGRIAAAMCHAHGFYAFTDAETGQRTLIILVASEQV